METQVNVQPGTAVEGRRNTYTDGVETWHHLRIPKNAATEPSWTDYDLRFNLAQHCQAIGMTGWQYVDRVSKFVGFDFDAVAGHAAGLSPESLAEVTAKARDLDYVEVRRSTSGKGLHLYVLLDDIPTANHSEHAALGRAILSMMGSDCGFDFTARVDVCGGNMWIWHEKQTGTNGLELIKPSARTLKLADLPSDWRNHIPIQQRARVAIANLPEGELDAFDRVCRSQQPVSLDQTHHATIEELANSGYSAEWVPEHHCLHTHTLAFAKVFDPAKHRGVFKTDSSGSTAINCFAFPLEGGGWKVVRFGNRVREANTWSHDDWTSCLFNAPCSLETAARYAGGAELPKAGGYQFSNATAFTEALAALGEAQDIPQAVANRPINLRRNCDGRLVVEVTRHGDGDRANGQMNGWVTQKTKWQRVFGEPAGESAETIVRELLGESLEGRAFNDPLILAKIHLKKWATDKGEQTLAYFCGQTYRYDLVEGWEVVKPGELDPWIRQTVQEVFDQVAKQRGVTPSKVTRELVTDVFKAMQSLCACEISKTVQAPFWLQPHDWRPDDVLVFKNGFLNVRRYIEGRTDYFMPKTPKLFFEHAANFDFQPNGPAPVEWHRFLGTLKQDENWCLCLQQIFGYCLWRGYDLQKFFMLVGPPRSGKGTITGVLKNLLGGQPAICSPGLEDLVKDFGLEQALGKRLAIVPEVTLPRQTAAIVANLKAWTGGDSITINRKYQKNVGYCLKGTRIIMQSNDFVPLPDNSGALNARLIPLKLTESYCDKERIDLAEALVPEYPAILRWALEGLKRLYEAGKFTLPESSKELCDDFRSASSPIKAFVGECCELGEYAVQKPALHKLYQRWKSTREDALDLDDGQFAVHLRSAVGTVTTTRQSAADKKHVKENIPITETPYDTKTRANVWIGIRPRPAWLEETFLATCA
jgi:P4 family phage/plasmid primase-like protien